VIGVPQRICRQTKIDKGSKAGQLSKEAEPDVFLAMRNKQNEEIRKSSLVQGLRRANLHLQRPLGGLEITICNILNSKGLGADVVFLLGFDQGKFPTKAIPTEGEIYQMLVAITRAKKRIYLINTVESKVSKFGECLDTADLEIEEIETT
jgi:superfamily I DNA/RNA helicase